MTRRPASTGTDPSALPAIDRLAVTLGLTRVRFEARWPITDDTLTLSQLENLARPRLDAMAKQHNALLFGTTWRVIGGPLLEARADALAPPGDAGEPTWLQELEEAAA